MRQYTRENPGSYELRLVDSPDGRLGALIQFPDGYLIFNDPEELREFVAEASVLWAKFRAAKAAMS